MTKLLTAALTVSVLALSLPAAAQPANHNPAMRGACAADLEKFCADAKPGQATMQCLMKNRDNASDGCKQAMANMRGQGMGQMNQGAQGDAMKEQGQQMAKDKMKDKAGKKE
ncbi:MAG: cysteine rich repeat-containing protein [Rhodospirillaceae bacterium]|nr:cysteine rich repeat-containing protein [Rhodospirillaceae bacterium]